MAKCGACGKFLAAADCIRCTKCPVAYHPVCLGVTSTKVSPNWLCPVCKAKLPRTDNSATPVKGLSDDSQQNITQPILKSQPAVEPPSSVLEHINNPTPSLPSQPLSSNTTESRELDIAYEIRCFREELSAMRVELREFRDEMANFRTDVGVCKERLNVVESKVSLLEKRFEEKEPSSYDHLEGTIAELKLQLHERDQDLLLNDVIIAGIPESKDESPLHIFKVISSKLGIEID